MSTSNSQSSTSTSNSQSSTSQLSPTYQSQSLPYRSAYSKPVHVALTFNPADNMTQQNFKDECDINNIMARYAKTGILPDNLNPAMPQYLDATGFDFSIAMNLVAEATSSFAQLPADVRSDFNHDPALFLDFVADPANGPKLAEMGLTSDQPDWLKGAMTPAPSEFNQGAANPPQNQNPLTAAPQSSSEKNT